MDSVKVVFLLTLYSFVEGHAKISRQRYRRAMGKNKAPTIFNKNIYNIPSILKDIRDNPNRRSFVSAEDPEPNIYVLQLRTDQMLENHFDTFLKSILDVFTNWKIDHDRGLVRLAEDIMSEAELRDAKLQTNYNEIKKAIDTLAKKIDDMNSKSKYITQENESWEAMQIMYEYETDRYDE